MNHIRQSLIIEAPARKIFEALTTVEGLQHWWTPVISEENKGKVLRFNFGPDYYKKMQVLTTEPDQYVAWKCIEAVAEWVDTLIHFELTENGNRTILKFSHNQWKAYTDLFSQCSFDWAMFLRSLRLYCQTGQGLPYPNQHQ